MSNPPKAALYYYPGSIWSAVALLALSEKGYGDDEVDLKEVDIEKGENFAPSFLRLNVKATVPTLVAPLQKTLQADMDVRYKALTDTKSIVEFLDKSRSALSRTHTTSSAPAPSLAPATIAFNSVSNIIIATIGSVEADPNTLTYLSARDDLQLKEAAKAVLPFLASRSAKLATLIADAEKDIYQVSVKTKAFWLEKKIATDAFLDVFAQSGKPLDQLDATAKKARQDYYAQAKNAWEIGLKAALLTLSEEMIGPLVLGDQVSLADLHLAAWFGRIAFLSGATPSDSGSVAVAKIESHVGLGSFHLPKDFQASEAQRTPTVGADAPAPAAESKLAAFWDTFKERPSWQQYYAKYKDDLSWQKYYGTAAL